MEMNVGKDNETVHFSIDLLSTTCSYKKHFMLSYQLILTGLYFITIIYVLAFVVIVAYLLSYIWNSMVKVFNILIVIQIKVFVKENTFKLALENDVQAAYCQKYNSDTQSNARLLSTPFHRIFQTTLVYFHSAGLKSIYQGYKTL